MANVQQKTNCNPELVSRLRVKYALALRAVLRELSTLHDSEESRLVVREFEQRIEDLAVGGPAGAILDFAAGPLGQG